MIVIDLFGEDDVIQIKLEKDLEEEARREALRKQFFEELMWRQPQVQVIPVEP